MYKGASQSLQRAHAVDRPHPARGTLDASSAPADLLPEPASLSIAELRDEQKRLRTEVIRAEQAISIAKIGGNKAAVSSAGQQKVVLTLRLSEVNQALKVADGPNELTRFIAAAEEVVGRDTLDLILAKVSAMRKNAHG